MTASDARSEQRERSREGELGSTGPRGEASDARSEQRERSREGELGSTGPRGEASDARSEQRERSREGELRSTGTRGLRAWILAARPATLGAAIVPVAVGSAVAAAEHAFALGPALAALLGAMAIQIGTNFVNDVYDFEKGADTAERLGPTRAVQAGLLSARQVRIAAIAAFLSAALCGLYLIGASGWPVAVIGIASIAAGFAYTGGPWPLAYLGLGDLFVMLFFGFVAVLGTVFVQTGQVPLLAWAAAVPVGALSTAILAVNNLRDRDQDLLASKRTLAVRFGKRFAIAEYRALLGAAYLVPVALVLTRSASPYALLPCLTLPLAARLAARTARESGRQLNEVLVGTAKLLLLFGALFAIGLQV